MKAAASTLYIVCFYSRLLGLVAGALLLVGVMEVVGICPREG